MKHVNYLGTIVVLIFMMAGTAYTQSPREQLQQLVEQLQRNPSDTALREEIIKFAQELKPPPSVPEEAERFEGRAQFAFKSAKSPADYLDAAREYEKAIAVAPWVPGYYSDLCTIYEKAEKYAEAKKNCGFFLSSSPSPQEASDVRKLIAGLEFAIEKDNTIVGKAKSIEGYWKPISFRISDPPEDATDWRSKEGDPYSEVLFIRRISNGYFEVNSLNTSHEWWNSVEDIRISDQSAEWFVLIEKDWCKRCGVTYKCSRKNDYEMVCEVKAVGRPWVTTEKRFRRYALCEPFSDNRKDSETGMSAYRCE